jgi:plasmid rolling circle replication initiator protein Rep
MKPDVSPSVFVDSINTTFTEDQPFLADLSPQDKPWDSHKSSSVKVSDALSLGYESHQKQSARMIECAKNLEFGRRDNKETGVSVFKLKTAYFCRVRHCPICQWRRSLMWVARFYQAFPKIYADHPDWRYIMVTFTVKNCDISDLKKTLSIMNSAWQRLTQRKAWPGLGFVRTTEVTRGAWIMKSSGLLIPSKKIHSVPLDKRELKDPTTAHPHYHVLIAVPPGYLQGKNYLSTEKWANLWQECLRSDYRPICYANVVKPRDLSKLRGKTVWESTEREDYELSLDEIRLGVFDAQHDAELIPDGEVFQLSKFDYIFSAIKEVIKYAVKPDDMLLDHEWLIELSTQLKNTRAVALGGEFKKYLSEDEPTQQELVGESEKNQKNDGGVFFGWRERLGRYQRVVK